MLALLMLEMVLAPNEVTKIDPLVLSFGSFGQKREKLPPCLARVSTAGKSVASSSELNDSMARYLEAFKTSLGDIIPGE